MVSILKKMKQTTILIFALLPVFCAAQKYDAKRAVLPATFSFFSGASWGLHETLAHKNDKFFKVFPGASQRFWGSESWRNKYKGGDPANGRNGVPIWFTDGKHLTATATQVFAFGAGFTIAIGEKRPAWHYLLDAGISFAAYSFGNFVTYDLIFK